MELNIDVRLIFALMNGKVSAAINKKLQRNFTQMGYNMTPEMWTILLHLSEEDNISQRKLCDTVYKDKPSVTRLLDTMEELKLVERHVNQRDKRSNLIRLTDKGRRIQEKTQIIAIRTLKQSLQGLGMEDISVCQEVLRRVFENTKRDSEE